MIQVNFDGALIRQLGAYIKTDLSAVRQINGVATGVIGVIGLAEGGQENVVYRVRSHAEAVSIFRSGPLVDHIKTMFLGGAGEVAAVRIGAPTPASLTIADVDNGGSAYDLGFTSIDKSTLANSIMVQIDVDDGGTLGIMEDDKLILTIMQKNPDCTVIKEVFESPRVFSDTTVLFKRGDKLYFVQDWIVQQAQNAVNRGAPEDITPEDRIALVEEALLAILQDMLLPTDYVQIFHAEDPVPIGFLLYEVNEGGLFGFEKSRLVTANFNNDAAAKTTDIADLFPRNATPFFNTNLNRYSFTTVASPTFTADGLIQNNTEMLSDFYALSGGWNGNDGTGLYGFWVDSGDPDVEDTLGGFGTIDTTKETMASWVKGLQALESEEVNFVQPAYNLSSPNADDNHRTEFFDAVTGYILGHVKLMSSVSNRKRRTTIIGYPAPQLPSEEKGNYLERANLGLTALAADTDRVQAWVAPFYSSVITGNRTLFGTEFFASYIAGLHANREPQESITFNPVGSLGAEFLYEWNYNEKDTIISQRQAFVERVKNSFGATYQRIHHNPTTWLGSVSTGYQEFILRRIDDFVSTFLFKNTEETFIGRPSYGARTEGDIQRYVSSLLSSLVGKQIVAYRDVVVRANEDKTAYYVEFEVQPVTEIKFILMTMRVSFDLE